jgi:hypothetical protein
VVRSVVGTDVRLGASDEPFGHPDHPDLKEPIMFQPSTLHTGFARQAQDDRAGSIRVSRLSRYERRERFAALVAAIARPFRSTAQSVPALDAERPATV